MVAKTLCFSRDLYSRESVKKAVQEYQNAYGSRIGFKLKNSGGYSEVAISAPEKVGSELFDEFSNFVFFLNIK